MSGFLHPKTEAEHLGFVLPLRLFLCGSSCSYQCRRLKCADGGELCDGILGTNWQEHLFRLTLHLDTNEPDKMAGSQFILEKMRMWGGLPVDCWGHPTRGGDPLGLLRIFPFHNFPLPRHSVEAKMIQMYLLYFFFIILMKSLTWILLSYDLHNSRRRLSLQHIQK